MIRPMGSVIKSLSKERHKTVYPLCRNGFKVSKTHSHSIDGGCFALFFAVFRSIYLSCVAVFLRSLNRFQVA